ncbi:hypothetical protein AMR41_26220 [Hapalosiphon sp. MRB220]|nr:hypothetical protein AMR41_26220 [Hapalosiphon sp. MRB220]
MLNKRLNYNIPCDLVGQVRLLAEQDGVTPNYWLRKAIEQVVRERNQKIINLSKLEAFDEQSLF